jgi:hypothetical protein
MLVGSGRRPKSLVSSRIFMLWSSMASRIELSDGILRTMMVYAKDSGCGNKGSGMIC